MSTILLGATGLIGKAVVQYCKEIQKPIVTISHQDYNFENLEDTVKFFNQYKPLYIINCLGFNGGIKFNQEQPADIFERTVRMNINIFSLAANCGVKKVVSALTSCAYPYDRDSLIESDFLNGVCHPSVECHGMAKRAIYTYAQQLNKQYRNLFVFTVFNNCYGIGDRFDTPNRLKVCGDLIQKFVLAVQNKDKEILLMGDGSARREHLNSKDAAESLVYMLDNYNDYHEPINVGWGRDYSIKELAILIKEKSGYKGKIVWMGGPNGQMKKLLNINKMVDIGFHPQIKLEDGVESTISWYKNVYQPSLLYTDS